MTHTQNLELCQYEILLFLSGRKENHLFMKTLVKDYDVFNKLLWFKCQIMSLDFHSKILSALQGNYTVGLPHEDPCYPTR